MSNFAPFSAAFLSLNSSRRISACKGLNLFSGYKVKVTGDSVLKSGCGNTEFKCGFEIFTVKKSADNSAGKRISAAYTIYNGTDGIFLGVIELLGIT